MKKIYLGTSSISLASHATLQDYYTELTNDNFSYTTAAPGNGTSNFTKEYCDQGRVYTGGSISLSYNASTGYLTVSNNLYAQGCANTYGSGYDRGKATKYFPCYVYCTYIEH